jgi:CDP-diacylglycerol pyrophosphatase
MFWGSRIRETDLSNVDPFRLTAEALAGKAKGPGDLTIAIARVHIESDDEFLIFASCAKAPGALRLVGADDLLYPACPAGPRLAG